MGCPASARSGADGLIVNPEYKQYKEGELCVELNKRVHMLIVSTPEFFVF
jgi:hypothetical protein